MTRSEALQSAKPILFNTEMVRAIQNATKTATRRLMKPQPESVVKTLSRDKITPLFSLARFLCSNGEREWVEGIKMPYQEGDILYVRETWCRIECENCDGDVLTGEPLSDDCPDETGGCYRYRASCEIGGDTRWHPSIHMPKEAARIFLRVTGVQAERLQNIKLEDFLQEGIGTRKGLFVPSSHFIASKQEAYWYAKDRFEELWDSTLKKSDLDKYGWDANPWVWVIEFERLGVTE